MEFLILLAIFFFFYTTLSKRISWLEEDFRSFRSLKEERKTNTFSFQKNSGQEKNKEEQELCFYIRRELDSGVDQREIFEALSQNGWKKSVIAEAFVKVGKEKLSEVQQQKEAFPVNFKEEKGKPTSLDKTIKWLSTDWLMKIGALLVIIGFGWFVSYAFMNNWIGPIGRITLGILLGLSVLLLGEGRIRKYVNQGAVLLSLGTTIMLITILAAQNYGYFSPNIALVVILLNVVFMALSSVRHRSLALAILSIVLGSIAPFFTNSNITDVITMFPYLLVISFGSLWVVAITGWRSLASVSLTIVILFSSGWIFDGLSKSLDNFLLLFSSLFAILYFVTNVVAMIKSTKTEKADLFVAGANSCLLLWWISAVAPEGYKSLITAVWALVFSLAAFGIFKSTKNREPFFLYAAVAAGMLAAATAFELSGPALTLAYIFEIGFIVLVASFVLNSVSTSQSIAFLLIFPGILSLNSVFSRSWTDGVLHGDFFVLLSMAFVLLGLGIYFYSKREIKIDPPSLEKTNLFLSLGSIYALILIWLVPHSLSLNYDIATAISLVVYTLIGLFFYVTGQIKNVKLFRSSGAVLLGFVIARLVFIDVWELELVGRVIVFILIGALLISSAFMGRLKDDNLKEENEEK